MKVFIAFLVFASVAASDSLAQSPSVEYEYDKYGNCTATTTKAAGGVVLEKTTYTYDAYRRKTSMVEAAHTSEGLPPHQRRQWNWVYDRYFDAEGGLPPRLIDASAHTSAQWRVQIEPAYDATGNRRLSAQKFDYNDQIIEASSGLYVAPNGDYTPSPDTEVHSFSYDPNGNKQSSTDPRGRVTTYEYDLRNRLWKTIEPLNRITETLYDTTNNKTLVKFPVESAGQRTQQWLDYDGFGQPGRFIDERNNTTNLTYWWGPMKKLRTVTTHRSNDGGGTEPQLTTFMNDGMGRQLQILFPDLSYEDSTYEFGQLKTFKTRKGQVKTINYDARGREISHSFSGDSAPKVSRSWDDANRLSTICNIFSTIDYGYDGSGLVATEGNAIAGSGPRRLTIYQRYRDGSVSDVQYPNGVSIHRDYTARGQLKRVADNIGGSSIQTVGYTYLPDGKVDFQDHRSGIRTQFGYDARGFTNLVRNYNVSSGQELSRRDYHRDTRDRIVAFQKGNGNPANPMEDGRGDHYWYDAEGQLTDAYYGAVDPVNNPHAQVRQDHFEYDQLGNRQSPNNQYNNLLASKGWMKFLRKDNGLNQYRAWWDYAVINYDDDIGGDWGAPQRANGVLMQDGYVTAGYNALNQMMMVNTAAMGSDWMFFGYDPLGRCVKRWSGALDLSLPFPSIPAATSNPATYFYYDGWNLIQEGPSATNAARLYVHGGRVDEIVASYNAATSVIAYHYYDASGHATLLTDGTGQIKEQYYYDAFGKPRVYNASGTVYYDGVSPHGNRFFFTGREYLSELKLYDYRNRMYQPELGRFLQPDPKHFAAGDYNLYRYCHNDPVNKSDPDGLLGLFGMPDFESAGVRVSSDMTDPSNESPGAVAFRMLQAIPFPARLFGIPAIKAAPQLARETAFARGLASEARVLREFGAVRNTTSVATAEGRAIPDALTRTQLIEVKDAAKVTLDRQLRIETQAAAESGRQSVLITGTNTHVSEPAKKAFDVIIRRPDLGPKQ
jgi:RHS repeat-associated protein